MARDFPLVTVVVPAYNHEDYVLDCLSSIVEQDYPRIDLIIINDGSTDTTDAKIKDFVNKQPFKSRYISKNNEGLIKTLNLGMRLSVGDYFCQLATDDMLLPGSIKKRVDFLEANIGVDVVFADAYLMYDSKKTSDRLWGCTKKGYKSSEHNIKDFIKRDARIFFPSGMFRKSVLEKLGGFDEDFRYGEDVYTRFLLTLHATVDYLNQPVMYYRLHPSNTSGGKPLWTKQEKILALEKLSSSMSPGPTKRLIDKKLFYYYLKFYEVGIESGVERKELASALDKAIKLNPYSLKCLYYRMMLKWKGL
jgi:alpha-1,3-rhamnosyltransferase